MTAEEQRVPAKGGRRMTWEDRDFEFPDQPLASLSDIDEFLEDGGGSGERSRGSFSSEEDREMEALEGDEEREDSCGNAEESKKFWETQHQLLQGVLRRSTSTETRIRNATKEALKEVRGAAGIPCGCRPSSTAADCRSCLMREVCIRLQSAGFNAAICKSKWRSSSCMPSGEHTFVDVVDDLGSPKKGEVRVIIELNFRAEFMIARACTDYDCLVRQLPEVFVRKVEQLQGVIKILCGAAKKCMKEKKMHMGPWRKHRYMQAKWLGACERTAPLAPAGLSSIAFFSDGRRKPRASMLTLDLHEKLPDAHRAAVEVV